MRFQNAIKGIRKIYLAEILIIARTVLGIGIRVLLAVNRIDMGLSGEAIVQRISAANILAPFVAYAIGVILLTLAAFILNLRGVADAARDDGSFRRALWVVLTGIAVDAAVFALQSSHHWIASWLSIASTLCALMATLLVLEGVCRVADGLGAGKVSAMGRKSRQSLLCAFVLSAGNKLFVALFFGNPIFVAICGIAAYVLDFVGHMLYRQVLGRARLLQ